MSYEFKEVFMSGNIITNKTIRKLDFLRSQQEARILVLGRTNPEMFVNLNQKEDLEKELKQLLKELSDLMDENLYESGDNREESAEETRKENSHIVKKREELTLEIDAKTSALQFVNTNIMLIVQMDEVYYDCVMAYHDFVNENFEEFSTLVLKEKIEFKSDIETEILEEKLKIVEDFFLKYKGNGTK